MTKNTGQTLALVTLHAHIEGCKAFVFTTQAELDLFLEGLRAKWILGRALNLRFPKVKNFKCKTEITKPSPLCASMVSFEGATNASTERAGLVGMWRLKGLGDNRFLTTQVERQNGFGPHASTWWDGWEDSC